MFQVNFVKYDWVKQRKEEAASLLPSYQFNEVCRALNFSFPFNYKKRKNEKHNSNDACIDFQLIHYITKDK